MRKLVSALSVRDFAHMVRNVCCKVVHLKRSHVKREIDIITCMAVSVIRLPVIYRNKPKHTPTNNNQPRDATYTDKSFLFNSVTFV